MIHELDRRATDGLTVTLQWDDEQNAVGIHVDDHGAIAETAVAGDQALDAFWHPFCYVGTPERPEPEPDSTKVDDEEPAVEPIDDDKAAA